MRGLVSVLEIVHLVKDVPVQRGIDAHGVEVVATYSRKVRMPVLRNDRHYLSYVHGGREYRAVLPSVHGTIGDELCAEIDVTQPERARVCGTRGGLGHARTQLIISGVPLFLASAALLARRRWRHLGHPPAPAAGPHHSRRHRTRRSR